MAGARTVSVPSEEAGRKLADFVASRAPGAPRSAVMKWIRTGQVRVGGGRKGPFYKLGAGEAVRLPPQAAHADKTPAEPPPVPAEVAVVFEDDGLLVANKPAGLPTQSGTGHADSLAARLAARFAHRAYPPAPAHRIDRDTSGLVACGKTREMLARLSKLFASGAADKRYLAWVEGEWTRSGELADELAKRGEPGSEKMAAGAGRPARSEVSPLAVRGGHTLVLVRLFTGRTHQIRVQFASRGHPLAGDVKYGGQKPHAPHKLHAWQLEIDGRRFTAPPPWRGAFAVNPDDLPD